MIYISPEVNQNIIENVIVIFATNKNTDILNADHGILQKIQGLMTDILTTTNLLVIL